jgi:transposase
MVLIGEEYVRRKLEFVPVTCIVYTMVEMAKANGVNVYHYLTYLLEKMPNDSMSDEELELLAPWNENVKAEIERRAENSNQ